MHFQKRKLSEAMKRMIRKRINGGFRSPWLLFGLAMGLPAPVIIFFQFRTIPELQGAAMIVGYCLVGYLALCGLILFLQYNSRKKKRKLYELVFGSGNYQTIEVLEKRMNLSYRMNNVPQQIIRLKHHQEIIELKTFDLRYSNFFVPGPLKVLTHHNAPGIYIPENSWLAYSKKNKRVDSSYSV